MALTPSQVVRTWQEFVDALYHGDDAPASCKFTKADLAAAVSATDAWITANQATYVAALPNPFKNTSTAAEKAALFLFVANRRYRG